IFKKLHDTKPDIKGTLVGLVGNLKALQKGKRFIEEDLNRTWIQENLEKNHPDTHEQYEMFEIIEELNGILQKENTECYFIDCHTTSSDSLPYISVQEVGDNDAFAHKFPLHIVRGFSDIVNGSIDKFFSKKGFTGFTFEGGQHESKMTLANQETMIWLAMKEINELDFGELSINHNISEHFSGEQKTYKIIYRYGLERNDKFKMEPGFKNFEKISRGQLLAVKNGEPVKSEWDATIFMPLYQPQGNDGFFVIEEVKE
ncbi:MAG TPA: succinylglutamate desuccinylase/aspartoacylase family protein, partial [Salinimicrobium sp.]|nr:succinylglutamate desuccinylase/aspartoacylase family protein [Salinimicrobium sp.]